MRITICPTPEALGAAAAAEAAAIINLAIALKGRARVVLSTGASQFTMFDALAKQDVDFSKVEMFHLDEYAGLPITHPASFRKYLNERFLCNVNLKAFHYVDGTPECIAPLTELLRAEPVDLGMIGIGENAHIAFNDPPADFDTRDAYIMVDLDEKCKRQQVGEGWFKTIDDVPKQAVSMTCHQIMQCEEIISCVPYAVKAEAIRATLLSEGVTNEVPATLLKTHKSWSLYLDFDSSQMIDPRSVASVNANLSDMRYKYK